MWTFILTTCVSISMVMSLVCCLCWRKKTPKNEWLGLDGMVTQKNPDENVNHLPSAASCVVDGLNASGESLDSNKRSVATNTKRSLPDIPSEQGTAVNWEPSGDNSSEHYATVGQFPNTAPKRHTLPNGIEARPSISQHSSISQADDAFSPYERVKYDKIKPKEHPYAQLQPTTSRSIVYEEGHSSVEERINLLRVDTVPSSSEPSAPTRSRRSSAHSNTGATLEIPAASAVAGGIAASPELPYMTPPVTQPNFSGDSQDSTKGYTSISVREPLADILAQTKEMNKKKRELDPHYSTVSDDSDDVYTTIPDPNNQIYTSESETYARIPPLPITVEAEVNHPPPSQSPVENEEDSEVDDQLYEPPPHSAPASGDSTKQATHTHSHSRQASSSSSIAAIGSPKPEKRQANSPLPPPPTAPAPSFDFHADKLQAMRNLDDLYAKVHKNKKEEVIPSEDRSSDKASSHGDSVRTSVCSGKSSVFEEKQPESLNSTRVVREHNYETLKKSPRKISDPGYERIKSHNDEVGYASINGPESLTSSSDPGYEVLKNRSPSDSDPNYEQLRHKNSNLSDYGYSRVKEKIIDGYSVVNKRKNRLDVGMTFSSDNDTTEPNYESMPSEINDPNYAAVIKSNGSTCDPNYESVSQRTDPNYESVSQHTDPNYESVSQRTDPNYESVSERTFPKYESVSQSDPNYESGSLTDPNYESVKDLEPPYERLDEDSSRTNSDTSGYEKIKGTNKSHSDNSTSSNGKSDTEPPYEQLHNDSEPDVPGYEKINHKPTENDLNNVNKSANSTNANQVGLHVVVTDVTISSYIHEEDAIFQV